jgi:hypothetical protein
MSTPIAFALAVAPFLALGIQLLRMARRPD